MKTDIEIFVDNSILVGEITADGRDNGINHLSKKKNHKQWIPIFKSMQEYADQEMIAFAEWLTNNYHLANGIWRKVRKPYDITASWNELLTKYKEECKR